MAGRRDSTAIYGHILEAGAKLHLEGGTSAAACTLAHKFFTSRPAHDADAAASVCPWLVSGACLLLAAKSREDLVKLRDVTNVLYAIANPGEPPLQVDRRYWDMRESLGRAELVVLRALHFRVDVHTPHVYALNYLDTLRQWVGPRRFDQTPAAAVAMALCRDVHMWPELIEEHGATVVAAACVHVALQCAALTVATDGQHWADVLLHRPPSSSSGRRRSSSGGGGEPRGRPSKETLRCARRLAQLIEAHNCEEARRRPAERDCA